MLGTRGHHELYSVGENMGPSQLMFWQTTSNFQKRFYDENSLVVIFRVNCRKRQASNQDNDMTVTLCFTSWGSGIDSADDSVVQRSSCIHRAEDCWNTVKALSKLRKDEEFCGGYRRITTAIRSWPQCLTQDVIEFKRWDQCRDTWTCVITRWSDLRSCEHARSPV